MLRCEYYWPVMRQKLIKWLIEDIIPEAQHTRDPEGSILKFASGRNLPPAQVESLGQLFNTAKTLSHLEKSANRGVSFPIIDVPAMVGKYLQVPAEARTEETVEKDAGLSLPQCLAGWQNLGMEQEEQLKIASTGTYVNQESIFARERETKNNRREAKVAMLDLELTKQARFDFAEEGRGLMEDIHVILRSNPDISFSSVETDGLSLHGEEATPVFEKLASYLAGRRWRVKRGSKNDIKRLIPDYAGAMEKIATLVDLYFMGAASDDAIKKVAATAFADVDEKTEHGSQEEAGMGKGGAGDGGARGTAQGAGREATPVDNSKKNDSNKGQKSQGGANTPRKSEDSFFGGINRFADTAAGKGYELLQPVLQKALTGTDHKGQRQVDTDHIDARHMATLQKLMMTDEVLAESDPEKVISIYNTLREVSPHLAGDANVARVVLRTAVQHDGISSFDIKSFLDTESARQKTDYNHRLQDALNYKGQEMGNRPA